ncbi:DUF262 domain-containing protein [Streptomyces phaeochromogenes]|nr:DUF262 domain-containing protein [Streptomyces phaeochromogenes]
MKMEPRSIALDKIFKRRGRYDIPDWQRDEVWSPERKQLLIDSILNGWKLPKFYFAKTASDPDEFDVVDGQQRLSAIWEFFENKLRLSEETAQRFGGHTYSELPYTVTDSFDDFEIQYDEITDATDDEIQGFFQRLQQGMMLTSAEKLNSINSSLTRFARQLAAHSFFQDKVAASNSRKAYFDIVVKTLALESEGFGMRLRYEDLKEFAESHVAFSENSPIAARLTSTLDYLDRVFAGKSTFLRNRSTIQSLITLAADIVDTGRADGTEERFRGFVEKFGAELAHQNELGTRATDGSYLDYQRTLSANVKAGPRIRHEILMRKLLLSDPSWIDIFGTQEGVSGVREEIDRLGQRVASLVSLRNEEHSAKTGKDFIKLTNRTVTALSGIREPVENFEGYSNMIGDLYFTLREGPGQRLEQIPSSFEDVNLLRTGLQHDVDHGKAGDVAKKRIKIGAAFAKYASGDTSPHTLAPERFQFVQAALLQAIVQDLENLSF